MTKTKPSTNNLSSELQGDMDELDETMKGIEKHLEPFFKASLKETKNNLSGLQIAKLNIVIAYSINTLFFMYLKTQGINPKEHQVMTELDRVRLYIKKVKELTDKENPQKPTLLLNKAAAQRFISHALSDQVDKTEGGEKEKEGEQKREQDKQPEKKKKEKGKSKDKDKDKGGKSNDKDKENKAKHKNKEREEKEKDKPTPKSNKRQSPDKVTENTDKKKRRK